MATLTPLVSFDGVDGNEPEAGLVLDAAGDLFGTTYKGGTGNYGTVFEIANAAGLYAGTPETLVNFNATDGAGPYAGLIADAAGDLFGTTTSGGTSGDGTVFEIARTSGKFAATPTILASFNGTNGQGPFAGLFADGAGDLFGSTGGQANGGTVFEISASGSGAAPQAVTLVAFNGADGARPFSTLTADSAGDLFGTTAGGGASGEGTVFEIARNASGYASTPVTLVTFNGTNGAFPYAGLITDAAGDLFGTTYGGGANADGTVFEIAKTAGGYASQASLLVSFNGADGSKPYSSLIADAAGNLFGTTSQGGANGDGTVFEIANTATGYANTPVTLASFSTSSGIQPRAALIADAAGDLFGTTYQGGTNGDGTVFELTGSGFQVPGPSYVPPVITGATAGQAVTDETAVSPFSTVTITDANSGQTETVTVTLSAAANGTLSDLGGGTYTASTGVYTDTGSAAAVTSAVEGLVFTPTAHQAAPGQTVTTTFTIADTDTAGQSVTNDTASVIVTETALTVISISGALASQSISDTASLSPFSSVTIADAGSGQTETVTITLSAAANGALSNLGGGSYNVSTGVYTDTGSAAAVTSAVEGLVFTPTAHQAAPGQTVTTTFTISDTDTAGQSATSNTASVIVTETAQTAVSISGTRAAQSTNDTVSLSPFSGVTIADTGSGQTETVTVTLSAAANGKLSNLGGGSYNVSTGVYKDTGSAAAVTSAVEGLVFTPTAHQAPPGQTVTTTFTIADADTEGQSVSNNTTTVIATAVAAAMTITGMIAGQAVSGQRSVSPFSTVTITDPNAGQTETVTITLSAVANGTLSNLGGGSYNASTGVYTDTGSATAVTSALDGLIFTPTAHQAASGQAVTTTFTIADTDTAGQSATNDTTTVIATALAAPVLTGATANQAATDQTPVSPFSTVTITDANSGQTETVTVTLSAAANGTLSNLGGGTYTASTGVYTDTGSAAAITSALNGLVFTPTAHQVPPGQTVTTTFTIADTDTAGQLVSNNTTTVNATATAVVPEIAGVTAGQTVTGQTPITVFPTVTITDANVGQIDAVAVTLSAAANGTLSNLSGGIFNAITGIYTDNGSAAAITSALNGLVFTPAPSTQTVTTTFTITDTDTAGQSAANNTTSVIAAPPGSNSGGLLAVLTVQQQLELLYIAYFNRAADEGGFSFWENQNVNAQHAGQSAAVALTNIANSFAPQTETEALYPSLAPYLMASPPPLNAAAGQAAVSTFIAAIYENLFNRTADAAGASYWAGQITSGAVGPGAAALAIANGATGADAIEVENKIAVAFNFTTQTGAAGLGMTAPYASTLVPAARAVLNNVDGTSLNDASVTRGEATAAAYVTNASVGTSATSAEIVASASQVAVNSDSADGGIITVTNSNQLVDPGAGSYTLRFLAGAGADTLVLHPGSVDQVLGFDPGTDVLDIASLLAAANVTLTGDSAALSGYVTVVDQGADALVNFDPSGHGGGATAAVLLGLGSSITSLTTLIAQGAIRME